MRAFKLSNHSARPLVPQLPVHATAFACEHGRAVRLRVRSFDTRVHLLARGPHIAPGSSFAYAATFVDLAPTFLAIAGVPKPPSMDGKSLLPLLQESSEPTAAAAAAVRAGWRKDVLLEYLYNSDNDKCVRGCNMSKVGDYPRDDEYCIDLAGGTGCWGPPACRAECYPTESPANNWRALRSVDAADDFLCAAAARPTDARPEAGGLPDRPTAPQLRRPPQRVAGMPSL